jgi:hypothetical protein
MSKLDAQRAMREANYARNSGPRAAASGEPAVAQAARAAQPAGATAAAPVAPTDGRCGHKSMNGRACSREAAHPEKSHRYS